MKIAVLFLSFCLAVAPSADAQNVLPFVGAEVRVKQNRRLVVTQTFRFTLNHEKKGSVLAFPLYERRLAPGRNFIVQKYEVQSLLRSFNDGPFNTDKFTVSKGVSANIYHFGAADAVLMPGNYTYLFQYEMSAGVLDRPDGELVRLEYPGLWGVPVGATSIEIIPPAGVPLDSMKIRTFTFDKKSNLEPPVSVLWQSQSDRVASGILKRVEPWSSYGFEVVFPVGTFDPLPAK